MKHYLLILKTLFKFSQIHFLEYRADFLLTWVGDGIMVLFTLAFFQVIYKQTSAIAGWSQGEIFLLLATVSFIEALVYFFYLDSIRQVSRQLPTGEIDTYLTKPVDFQFLITFRSISPNTLGPLVPAIVLTYLGIHLINPPALVIKLGIFFLLLIVSLAVHYSLILIITSCSFLATRLDAVMHLDGRLRDLASKPLDVYPKYWQYLFFTLLPVAFFGYIPTQVFRPNFNIQLVVYALLFAAVSLVGSRKFFYWALRHYSSASS